MAYKHTCLTCGREFEHQQQIVKSCSEECHRKRQHKLYGIHPSGLPTNFLGRLHEYEVMCDLGRRNFDVFMSAFPQQKYDLVISSRETNETFKVEVKTGYRAQNGHISLPKHSHDDWDIMAIVIKAEGSIVYKNKNEEDPFAEKNISK